MRAAVLAFAVLTCRLAWGSPPGMTEPDEIAPTPASPPPATPAEPGVKSYRTQTLIADGIAVGLVLLAADSKDHDRREAYWKLSLGTYLFGAPLVHLSKNRSGHALGSVAMRVGFPLLGALIADGTQQDYDCYGDYCESNSDDMVLGAVLGAIAASAVDAIYLAKGDAPKPPPAPAWQPTLRASASGVALGVAGNF